MTTEVAVIDPDATIQAAARLMRNGKFGYLPVVDSQLTLIGMLSTVDLLGILEHVDLGSTPAAPRRL